MSQRIKRPRNNPLNKRCDSCGNPSSNRKYNHSYLCCWCLAYGKDGMSRDETGTIFSAGDYYIKIKEKKRNET